MTSEDQKTMITGCLLGIAGFGLMVLLFGVDSWPGLLG
jgi:hypothetical protein